jgi:hypothetical protein
MAENRICKKTGKQAIVLTDVYVAGRPLSMWDKDVLYIYCSPKYYDKILESLTRPETKLDRYLRGEDDI